MGEEEEKVDVKIGTKREALWTTVKENAIKALDGLEKEIEINEELIKLADTIIIEEQKV
ncbi:MAG: hypothetical protein HC874_27330 [Richelia sp. SL_2_1]|nr:hypothetical protein [Richelia sp. SL_2_1]